MFNLITSTSQLKSSAHNRANFHQLSPSRDITLNNFPNGNISIKWELSGTSWWLPMKSYIRLRCRMSKGNGDPLTVSDGVAPTMNLANSLFNSVEVRLQDKTISKINDYVAQCDTLTQRLTKSKAWLDSVGQSAQLWSADFNERRNVVCSDAESAAGYSKTRDELGFGPQATLAIVAATGVLTFAPNGGIGIPDCRNVFPGGSYIRFSEAAGSFAAGTVARVLASTATTLSLDIKPSNDVGAVTSAFERFYPAPVSQTTVRGKAREFELTFQPPLSIFRLGHALPVGQYELILTPSQNYQRLAFESLVEKTPGNGANDVKFEILDMQFLCYQMEAERVGDLTYNLDLEEVVAMTDKIASASFIQNSFDVPPSVYGLTVAYQDIGIGASSLTSASRFVERDGNERRLNRFFMQYSDQKYPYIDSDAIEDQPNFIDYFTQRYSESIIQSGTYFLSGGAETLTDWRTRGNFYYWPVFKDATDRSTRVSISQSFQPGTNVDNLRILLFAHYRQLVTITIRGGRVVDMKSVTG